ncbi:hypothetical protein NIE88_21605 [Sporolactobacillus shoreicorticis]|uniref:Uncharacterized protein n=1 Tax=Sporolactobacillus shoreicorticis TaxID=1923877 RepID=A0ABW5RZL9_9BACL|nr:hypothetical protein [Sporolactobacillus shoreicorticis]MCO7128326.1 hypothetical protein [Sporolactobacillus shoreicorticis]
MITIETFLTRTLFIIIAVILVLVLPDSYRLLAIIPIVLSWIVESVAAHYNKKVRANHNQTLATIKKYFAGKRFLIWTLPFMVTLFTVSVIPSLDYHSRMLQIIVLIAALVTDWALDKAEERKNQNSDS